MLIPSSGGIDGDGRAVGCSRSSAAAIDRRREGTKQRIR